MSSDDQDHDQVKKAVNGNDSTPAGEVQNDVQENGKSVKTNEENEE